MGRRLRTAEARGRGLVPEPGSADLVFRRIAAALHRQHERQCLVPGGGVRYYRETPAGWRRIVLPGAPIEYPLTSRDRALLQL